MVEVRRDVRITVQPNAAHVRAFVDYDSPPFPRDFVQVTDSVVLFPFVDHPVADAVTLVENLSFDAAHGLTDLLTMSDAVALSYGFTLPLADAVTMGDSLVAVLGLGVQPSETVVLTDQLTFNMSKAIADVANAVEGLTFNSTRTFADTLTMSDSVANAPSIAVADVTTPGDAAQTSPFYEAADAATTTDASVRGVGKVIADSVTMSENASSVLFTPAMWDSSNKSANVTLSNNNTRAFSNNPGPGHSGVRATKPQSAGKLYFEEIWSLLPGGHRGGLVKSSWTLTLLVGGGSDSIGWVSTGSVAGAVTATVATYTTNDVLCWAVDFTNGRLWLRVNGGNWNNSGTADPAANVGGIDISTFISGGASLYIAASIIDVDDSPGNGQIDLNGGATFTQAVPTGFTAW